MKNEFNSLGILDQKIRQRYKEIDINTGEKRIFSKDNILNEQSITQRD